MLAFFCSPHRSQLSPYRVTACHPIFWVGVSQEMKVRTYPQVTTAGFSGGRPATEERAEERWGGAAGGWAGTGAQILLPLGGHIHDDSRG